jgi:RNA polymerase sigma-70 factor (ECF subfamily)
MVSNPDEAADIAQDVFIRAFQNMHRFDGRASLRTWLFRIAHNLCIDRARKLGRLVGETSLDVAGDEEGEMEVADQRWDPETLVMDREMHEVVEAALASMSEKLRVVLLLHDREDLAYEEIAETLGLPVGTVKSRLFLARAHLQREVGPYLGGRT